MEIDVELIPAEANPDIDPELPAEWGNFRGNDDNNGVTDAKTPKSADDAELYWATSIATGGQANGAPGTPIIINGELYSYSGKELLRLDAETGEILARGEMQGSSPFAITPPGVCRGHDLRSARRRHGAGVQREDAGIPVALYRLARHRTRREPAELPDHLFRWLHLHRLLEPRAGRGAHGVSDDHGRGPEPAARGQAAALGAHAVRRFYWAGALATEKFVLVGTEDGEKGV